MNRLYILYFILIMFLSCGNASDGIVPIIFAKAAVIKEPATVSKEQKMIASKLEDLFTGFHKLGMFNGSILVAKAGRIIFQKSLGIANKSTKEGLTDSSMYQLASVSKVITATAVMLLHEREMIDINKNVQEYFPDFPYQGVTVKQLLCHRSGLPNYLYFLNHEIYLPNYQMSNEDMYKFLVTKNPKKYSKPNYRFNYSNTNYALLALLVEKISGKSFQDFVRDELFKPLGMKHTCTIKDLDLNNPLCTKPYDNRWRPVNFDASDYVLGDKSIYSTPYDLFLFSEALYQNKIISKATQEMAYSPYSKEIKAANYGFGWRMKNFNDPAKKEVYHNGWWHGYRSSFHRRLSDTLTVIILSNQLNQAAYHTHKVYEIIDSTTGSDTEDGDE
ncbi:MAG: serine hydrolase domain-containing protein [Bacteroidota bacterium]